MNDLDVAKVSLSHNESGQCSGEILEAVPLFGHATGLEARTAEFRRRRQTIRTKRGESGEKQRRRGEEGKGLLHNDPINNVKRANHIQGVCCNSAPSYSFPVAYRTIA